MTSALIWNDMATVPRDGTFIWGETSPEWIAWMRWTGREWRGAGDPSQLYDEPLRWMPDVRADQGSLS